MLNIETQARLDRAIEIKGQIEALETELEQVLNGGPVTTSRKFIEAADKPPKKKKREYKRREIHSKPPEKDFISTGTARKRKEGAGCDECGSPSRHRKTCSKSGAAAAPKTNEVHPLDERRVLSKEQYDSAKTAHFKHGFSADALRIHYQNVTVKEIERAIAAENYEDYLAS